MTGVAATGADVVAGSVAAVAAATAAAVAAADGAASVAGGAILLVTHLIGWSRCRISVEWGIALGLERRLLAH